jgi:hypothetical protein
MKKKPIPQKYRVRLFVAKTYDVHVEAHSLDNARLQAKIKLFEGRGQGFRRGRELIVIESWTDLASEAGGAPSLTNIGNLDNPLFIVPVLSG